MLEEFCSSGGWEGKQASIRDKTPADRSPLAHTDHGWHFWQGANRAEVMVQPVNDLQKAPQPLCASVSLSLRSRPMQQASREKALRTFKGVKNSPLVSPGLIGVPMPTLQSVQGHPL